MSERFSVRIYNGMGVFWAEESGLPTEADAREAAMRWSTNRGQRSWRVEVWRGAREKVLTLRGGKEMAS